MEWLWWCNINFCNASYLRVYEHSKFTHYIAKLSSGAIILNTGGLTIQGNASFDRNMAYTYYGGAMMLYNGKSKISGNLYLNNNTAIWGGAIYIEKGILFIQGYTLLNKNYAKIGGGALYITSADFKLCGSVYCRNNTAEGRGGALHISDARALFNDKCPSESFHKQSLINFSYNTAVTGTGGSIHCWEESSVKFIGIIYFSKSEYSAVTGEAKCNITFAGTTYFNRNMEIDGGAIRIHDSRNILGDCIF